MTGISGLDGLRVFLHADVTKEVPKEEDRGPFLHLS